MMHSIIPQIAALQTIRNINSKGATPIFNVASLDKIGNSLEVAGKFGVYHVKWERVGFTFGDVVIYGVKTIKTKRFFGLIVNETEELQELWRASDDTKRYPEHMHKNEMLAWFKNAVDRYEAYLESWR